MLARVAALRAITASSRGAAAVLGRAMAVASSPLVVGDRRVKLPRIATSPLPVSVQ